MALPQWVGKKPGETFTYRGPNGTGQGYIDKEGKPRNEKGEMLFGVGNPYPVAGLASEIKAKLAGGGWEYTGPLPKEARAIGDRQTLTMAAQALANRSPTTMTNPLPNYQPLQMINTPFARSLATLITQHLASQPKPLVNTPLVGAPTQMGRL
jgi:hypothetical protein